MGKNKEYDPNDIDRVQQGYENREADINKDVKSRKQLRNQRSLDNEKEMIDVINEIKTKYNNEITDPKLLARGFKFPYAFHCYECKTYKIFPFDF